MSEKAQDDDSAKPSEAYKLVGLAKVKEASSKLKAPKQEHIHNTTVTNKFRQNWLHKHFAPARMMRKKEIPHCRCCYIYLTKHHHMDSFNWGSSMICFGKMFGGSYHCTLCMAGEMPFYACFIDEVKSRPDMPWTKFSRSDYGDCCYSNISLKNECGCRYVEKDEQDAEKDAVDNNVIPENTNGNATPSISDKLQGGGSAGSTNDPQKPVELKTKDAEFDIGNLDDNNSPKKEDDEDAKSDIVHLDGVVLKDDENKHEFALPNGAAGSTQLVMVQQVVMVGPDMASPTKSSPVRDSHLSDQDWKHLKDGTAEEY